MYFFTNMFYLCLTELKNSLFFEKYVNHFQVKLYTFTVYMKHDSKTYF